MLTEACNNQKKYHIVDSERFLQKVKRPGRYIGMEWNLPQKDYSKVDVRIALAFPDLYEVGMSHLGLRILYQAVNDIPYFGAERVMAPGPDLEELLRESGEPLFTLETSSGIGDFDVLGFSLQYELCFTNVLNIMDLAGIPLRCENRDYTCPIVIAGGPCCYNPEPFAPFIDVFFIGEAEESLIEFLELVKEMNPGQSQENKEAFLKKIALLPGFYVPSEYVVKDGAVVPLSDAQRIIHKRYVKDLDTSVFPLQPLVPHTEIVHDRGVLEVFRGCVRGCRFCQAGMIYRPRREKSLDVLMSQADSILSSTGYDELGLLSLSTMDYSEISGLTRGLNKKYSENGISLSIPSSRVDAFSLEIAGEIQKVRKGSLTMAPEAGSQRMRDIINKNITEQEIIDAAVLAYQNGYRSIKFYMMIGLPFETDEDIEAIKDLLIKVKKSTGKAMNLTVSLGTFVPKPQTPFQWVGQDSYDSVIKKQRDLKDWAKTQKGIRLNYHEFKTGYLEAIIARGDRRVGDLLEAVFRLGARLDGWTEYFRFDLWEQAMKDTGIDGPGYACRWFEEEEALPWDHISCGVTKSFMAEEYKKSREQATTGHCYDDICLGCGVGCRRKGERP